MQKNAGKSGSLMTRGDGRKPPRKSLASIVFLLVLSLLVVILVTAFSLPQVLEASYIQYGPHLAALESFARGTTSLRELSGNLIGDDEPYHIVFSTSCSAFQDWQSYAFFYHAWKVKQPGTVTRIVTGCSASKEQKLRVNFKEQVETLSDKFFLYFTPDFSELNKGNYQTTKYFNKPFGVRSWLESVVGFPNVSEAKRDAMFVIMDPDMLLTKPLVNDFSLKDVLHTPKTSKVNEKSGEESIHVSHGSPFAARYGYGSSWLGGIMNNLTHVVGTESPLHDLSMEDAGAYYAIGPPYIATGQDMYNIVSKWAEFTPRVYDIHHQFLSEMFGFSSAAAHLELPHTVFRGLMVSDVGSPDEGWGFLSGIPRSEVCKPISRDKMPPVIHYCQRYALGRWFFGKYKLHENVFTCHAPLIKVPPTDVVVKYDYFIYPNKERVDYDTPRQELKIKQNGFALCFLIDAINDAGDYFRRNHCPNGANFNKTFTFHDIPDDLYYAIEAKTA